MEIIIRVLIMKDYNIVEYRSIKSYEDGIFELLRFISINNYKILKFNKVKLYCFYHLKGLDDNRVTHYKVYLNKLPDYEKYAKIYKLLYRV